MLKLWVKLEIDSKIVKDLIYTSGENYDRETFFYHLTDLCNQMNVPTPILLTAHFESYEQFNNMRFLPRDFVESVNFDKMVIENAII